ncbi:MAG: tripartite tricarboxylate transporter TctB family protein [Beijerinckiaceae bacterium]
MLLSDRVTGLTIAAIGALAAYGGSRLPPMPGQQIGPSVFPIVVGCGVALCGLLIAAGIGRQFELEAEADLAASADHAPPPAEAERPAWLAILPPALLLFYVLASERLGFLITAAIMAGTAAKAFGASTKLAAGLGVIAPLVIHLIFYKLLRVPLPPGLLSPPW